MGSKLRPGIKGHFLKEGGGYVRINSDGLRDREHSLSPPPNTLRIAVLGDSFTEAMQVNREEAFWAVMEKDLQGCGNLRGRQVEVLTLDSLVLALPRNYWLCDIGFGDILLKLFSWLSLPAMTWPTIPRLLNKLITIPIMFFGMAS